jgi:hypothetical protein
MKKYRKDPFTTEVKISRPTKTRWPISCRAVIDTGATRTSIDEGLARTLNLESAGQVQVRNANGVQKRELVWLQIEVFDEIIELKVSITDRSKLSCPILIGRDILHNAYTEEE